MRDILFRGKRLDNGEWITGHLLRYEDGRARINPRHTDVFCYEKDESIIQTVAFRVDPDTVGEYTGICDKNGKEIFEGDILKIERVSTSLGDYFIPPLEYNGRVFVRFDYCAWLWETMDKEKLYFSFPDAWCHFQSEVIGNIHDKTEGGDQDGRT